MSEVNLFRVECGDFKLEVTVDPTFLDAVYRLIKGAAKVQQGPRVSEGELRWDVDGRLD